MLLHLGSLCDDYCLSTIGIVSYCSWCFGLSLILRQKITYNILERGCDELLLALTNSIRINAMGLRL